MITDRLARISTTAESIIEATVEQTLDTGETAGIRSLDSR